MRRSRDGQEIIITERGTPVARRAGSLAPTD
ncbi:type II toxin-antitoxin system prevent-host-death family antitoxin [Garicola koreensis]